MDMPGGRIYAAVYVRIKGGCRDSMGTHGLCAEITYAPDTVVSFCRRDNLIWKSLGLARGVENAKAAIAGRSECGNHTVDIYDSI
jgi:hypothetical protein